MDRHALPQSEAARSFNDTLAPLDGAVCEPNHVLERQEAGLSIGAHIAVGH
jgi:hypothetical protein